MTTPEPTRHVPHPLFVHERTFVFPSYLTTISSVLRRAIKGNMTDFCLGDTLSHCIFKIIFLFLSRVFHGQPSNQKHEIRNLRNPSPSPEATLVAK
ncbi:hypothetical protein NPIL_639521 [Nephila pilipes]|uniref:Uncharacterized protein n=1 Tax=Nephila pilipes TaxID=299642 RepID=A0A8X6PW85_NEPPI|nr:hypothetical protein NPIL_639521 [Nephila pilipes]